MNIKEEAFHLHQKGLSYKEVGDKLGISKTTAYEYVKELKLTKKYFFALPVPNDSKSFGTIRNGSERLTKQISSEETSFSNQEAHIPKEKNIILSSPSNAIKEFTGNDLLKKKFVTLNFEGKFLELIGKPEKKFSAIIWGLPKGGKSNLAIRFADYLQEYFGKVLYVASEEGESFTLQQKFKEIGGSRVTILETRNRDAIRDYLKDKDFDYVFIDSINNAGIDSEFLELMKNENIKKSFISITQATKGGNFKGDQSLTHNCDFVIKVIDGVAYHEGRFGASSEMKIFEEPLYKKNSSFESNNKSDTISQEKINEIVDRVWNSKKFKQIIHPPSEKAILKVDFSLFYNH